MWTQEYEDYINKSPVWQDKRHRVVVVRAGGRCEQLTPDGRCTARAAHCHHLHYRNLFHERLEDLQALCETHHRAAHVWEKNPRCRHCRRQVFDDMEAVLGFVEQNEDLSWDELYDELPTACARCVDARYEAGQFHCNGRAGHPNGHHQPDPKTRTHMPTNNKASGAALSIAAANQEDQDDQSAAESKAKTKVKIIWTRWPAMEAMMDEKGARWEYRENVPLSSIDAKASRKNSTRLGDRIIRNTIESMLIRARRSGRLILPAPIIWRPKGWSLDEIVDGNHRDEVARRLGITHMAVYMLIDPGAATAEAVRRGANLIVGNGATPAEQMQNAAHHYWDNEKTGCTIQAAADEYGINASTLRAHVRGEELAWKISADGEMPIKGSEKLNSAQRVQLVKINNDVVLHLAVTRLLAIPRHTSDYAERLFVAFKSAKPATQESQLAAVVAECDLQFAERKEEMEARGGKAAIQRKVRRGIEAYIKLMKTCFPAGVDPKDVIFDPEVRAIIAKYLGDSSTMELSIKGGLV